MDCEENCIETSGASMITDVPESSDNVEVSESTGLSPTTQGLNLDDQDDNMGNEKSW